MKKKNEKKNEKKEWRGFYFSTQFSRIHSGYPLEHSRFDIIITITSSGYELQKKKINILIKKMIFHLQV